MNKKAKAVITVYLSLVLLLILALLTTTLEGVRLKGYHYIADAVSDLSAASVLADYCDALYDRYHVFGRTSVIGTKKDQANFINQKLENMLNKNLTAEGAFLWKMASVNTVVQDNYNLLDFDGAFFRQQAINYSEYGLPALALDQLMQALDIFSRTEDTLEIVSKKQEAENALSEIDKKVLSLMGSIDGILCDENGIKLSLFGKIKVSEDFVKKFLSESPSMENTFVKNADLFAALEKEYVNPSTFLEEMNKAADEYRQYEQELQEREVLAEQLQTQLDSTDNLSEKLSLALKIAGIKAGNLPISLKQSEADKSYNKARKGLITITNSCWSACKSALAVMKEIEEEQRAAEAYVNAYEAALSGADEWLDGETYNEFLSSLADMNAYLGETSGGLDRIPDFTGMKETLGTDEVVLLNIVTMTSGADSLKKVLAEENYLQDLQDLIDKYSFESLSFDYSGISLSKEKNNPLNSIKKIVDSGISGLVMPEGKAVSDKEFTMQDFPSQLLGISGEKSDSGIFKKLNFKEVMSASPFGGVKEIMAGGASALAEEGLFLAYLNRHFASFAKSAEQDSVCDYELEYILSGDKKDSRNLNSVVSKLFMVRFALCMVHILSDSEKTGLVREFALAVLGFTGMPVLVETLKYGLIFMWAFDAALIETSAILTGKKVALLPTKENFPLAFSELMLVNKSLIDAKVAARADDTGFSLDYSSYLTLFLLLQNHKDQNLRAMDVIQDNLCLEDPGFRMSAQIYGFNAAFNFELSPVFDTLPFSRGVFKKQYNYTVIDGAKY